MGKYDHLYTDPDTELWFNEDDNDLVPFSIKLPLPGEFIRETESGRKLYHPKEKDIDGYGRVPHKQKFVRNPLPEKLEKLQRRGISIEACWEEIRKDRAYYSDEIEFIEQEWLRRLDGYWCYINGKPTFIDGFHYFYMGYWEMDTEFDSPFPEYRSRDLKFFAVARHCDVDPSILGFNYPKHRREGATSKAACINYEIISRSHRKLGGIQSMREKDAEKVFQKFIVAAWKKLPFFFRPIFEGTTNPKKRLSFDRPGVRVTKEGADMGVGGSGLGSEINFDVSDKSAYDGDKLRFYHGDEAGKTVEENVYTRHNVIAKSLSVGNRKKLVGLAIYTSTVGEMAKGGGVNFKKLCKYSMYEQRNPNGQTTTGLINVFIPAFDGLEGFIDEFGNSVIEDPVEPVLGSDGDMITVGARTHIMNQREGYRIAEEWSDLAEEVRMSPITWKECWKSSAKDCNFNQYILERRLEDFTFGNKKVVTGNFQWKDDIKDSQVIWVPRKDGRFKVSYIFPHPSESNRQVLVNGIRAPGNTVRFGAGGDPFKFKKTIGGDPSDGGGAVFMRAFSEDLVKDVSDWKGHRFVCTYSNRPDKNVYGEDMLMMCVYYGCQMFPEINVDFLWEYFEKRDYEGYLFYATDRKTGRLKKTPGQNTTEYVKEEIYREYDSYINVHGFREVHDELLQDCLDIEDDMGPYDRFVAGGYALMCCKAPVQEFEDSSRDLTDFLGPPTSFP